LKSRDWLGFAGIKTIAFPAISKEQQFPEKMKDAKEKFFCPPKWKQGI